MQYLIELVNFFKITSDFTGISSVIPNIVYVKVAAGLTLWLLSFVSVWYFFKLLWTSFNYYKEFKDLNFSRIEQRLRRSKDLGVKDVTTKKVFTGIRIPFYRKYLLLRYNRKLCPKDIWGYRDQIESFSNQKIVGINSFFIPFLQNAIIISFDNYKESYDFKKSSYKRLSRFCALVGLNPQMKKVILNLQKNDFFIRLGGRGGSGKTSFIHAIATSLHKSMKNTDLEYHFLSTKLSDFIPLTRSIKKSTLYNTGIEEDLKEATSFLKSLNTASKRISHLAKEKGIHFKDFEELRNKRLFVGLVPPPAIIVIDEAHLILGKSINTKKPITPLDRVKQEFGQELLTHLNQNRYTNNFTIVSTPSGYTQDLITPNSLFTTFISGRLPRKLSESFHVGSEIADDRSLTAGKLVITSPSLEDTTVFKAPLIGFPLEGKS